MREYEYILTFNGTSETLTDNPAGWDRVGVTFERNWTYMSILRNLSLSLRFARTSGGGYDFIKAAYESQGIYANIGITINKRNPATNDYDAFYSGILDLTPNRFAIERSYIEAPILDKKKLQLFKSRDENEIDLFSTTSIDNTPLNRLPIKTIGLTPIDIYLSSAFTCEQFSRQSFITGEVTVLSWAKDFPTRPLEIVRNEIGDNFTVGTDEVIYTNSSSADVEVTVKIEGIVGGNGTILNNSAAAPFSIRQRFYVVAYNSLGVAQDTKTPIDVTNTAPALTDQDYSTAIPLTVTYVMTIPAGGYLSIFNGWQGDGGGIIFSTSVNIYDTTAIDVDIELKVVGEPETDCECFFVFEALTRALQILTSETVTSKILDSTLFGRTDSEFINYNSNGDYALDAIFTGRMCRQYPDAKFVVKFKDLFETFKALYNIGMGYDNTNDRFYIEDITTFFDANTLMFDLGEVSNLKITPLNEGYFNKIVAGCENEGDYEQAQGAYEFAVKREYSTPTPVKEDKNIRTKYRLDSVGIEFTRKNQYDEKANEDYRDDEAVFVVRTDGTNPVIDSTVTGFAGVENYYNTMLTPRQNLLRHANLIATTLFRKTDGVLKAQSVNKIFELTVNGVDENSDVTTAELGTSLIIPELYEFDSYVNTTIINILLNNPHGFIRFSNFGVNYEGYLMRCETGDYNKKASYSVIGRTVIPDENKIFEDGENFMFEDSENFIFED